MSAACPCGSGQPYAACCGPRHDGSRPAETPEALMRSRYSAFARGDGAYLLATREGRPARPGEQAELERWARSVVWIGLEVREATPPERPDEGFVFFVATYLEGRRLVSLAERSRFVRREGRWRYVEGEPTVTSAKAAPNEPCPCGSGRKLKRCHG